MKKGFTLIELMAVIVILGVIASITYPTVTNSIKNAKEKAYNTQVESIIEASHKWAIDNALDLSETDTTRVSVNDLISSGYITKTNEGKIYNPIDNTEMTGCVTINYSSEYNQYLYDYDSACVIPVYSSSEGVNKPQLTAGMTPIKWVDGLETETTSSDPDWYDYNNKMWANSKTADGSYWVWIPRYAYKITSGWHTNTTGTIDVKFLKNDTTENSSGTTIETSGYSTTGTNTSNAYFLHPAFQNETGNTKYGMWVAKFEMSNTTSLPKSVPNVSSLRSVTIGDMFTASSNMASNINYGWGSGKVDTHMMTNYEWGAVAYLTQSIYGKNGEVWINNSYTYTTGCAGNSVSAGQYNSGCQNAYNTTTGMNASTTGNITGIYDMSGGTWEFTTAYVNNGNSNLTTYGNSIVSSTINNNVYSVTTDSQENNYNANKNMYGDAVYETSSTYGGAYSWNSDYAYMPNSSVPWFVRGGCYYDGSGAGVFNFSNSGANASSGRSFRLVVLPLH